MKLIAKIVLAAAVLGVGTATILAAPTVSGGVNLDAALMRANTAQTQIQSGLQDIERLHLKAQKDKDVIKLNCVNDKLVQAKPEVNIADGARRDLESAGDQAAQTAALTRIENSAETVRKLREAASQCIDSKVILTESSNSFTAEGVNPVDPDPTTEVGVEPPAYASPPGN